MNLQALRLSFVALLMSATSLVHAADAPSSTATDAEKSYLAVRNSKDPKTQLLAERWYKLVQLREWSDASGKFKANAKYVEQDEAKGTVTLRVVKGTGKDQVVTDKTVVVDKLNKECQSRVKQIAFLTDKVDEAGKAEAEKAAKPKEGADAMMGPTAPPPERTHIRHGNHTAAQVRRIARSRRMATKHRKPMRLVKHKRRSQQELPTQPLRRVRRSRR